MQTFFTLKKDVLAENVLERSRFVILRQVWFFAMSTSENNRREQLTTVLFSNRILVVL